MPHTLVYQWIAALALFLAISDAYDGWEKAWRRQSLTADQVLTAWDRVAAALPMLATLRKEQLAKKEKLDNKYKLVDFLKSPIKKRLLPLCRLFIVNPTDGQHFRGSCAFVKPDIVATSAHCLFPVKSVTTSGGEEKDVPVHVGPEDGFVMFVVRNYGIEGEDEKNHATTTVSNAEIVMERWTPDAFDYDMQDEWLATSMDVAFLKVSNHVTTSQHLILTPPDGRLGGTSDGPQCDFFRNSDAMILGYPGAARGGQVAVSQSGKISRIPEKNNVILFKGDMFGSNCLLTKGRFGQGGSGGPIITAETFKGQKEQCEMALIGIYHGGYDDDRKCRNFSPLVTKQLIQALNIIDKVPTLTTGGSAEGVKLKKSDDEKGTQTLELSVT